MKVLVVGGGAREHAICWALRKSPRLTDLYCAPGNAGTAAIATNVSIAAESIVDLVEWTRANSVDLAVIGPEAPLAAGIVDAFSESSVLAIGPTARAAEIESSKAWAGQFVARHGIPAPSTRECRTVEAGLAATAELGLPVAIKADGLAAGKGVVIAHTESAARDALDWLLVRRALGAAGERVILQEFLSGTELSVLAFSDGRDVALMPPARDYKRAGEGDRGPNTGGMGAYCPPAFATPALLAQIKREILEPTIRALADEGRPYRGVLYAGIMVTPSGPRVLEFNCRLGDPETQVVLPLLQTDLLDVLETVARGDLGDARLAWREATACGVVLASHGYPGSYPTGRPIEGLEQLTADSMLFHAGTGLSDGRVVTTGGRVMTATGVGPDLSTARRAAYDLAGRVSFDGCFFRRDIAADDGQAAQLEPSAVAQRLGGDVS